MDLRCLHSFPTRRSSDLAAHGGTCRRNAVRRLRLQLWRRRQDGQRAVSLLAGIAEARTWRTPKPRWNERADPRRDAISSRSEEHTSELQSLTNLVCRLLL